LLLTVDTEIAVRALTRLGEHTEISDSDWGLDIEARSVTRTVRPPKERLRHKIAATSGRPP
jgi:hypothetical protein